MCLKLREMLVFGLVLAFMVPLSAQGQEGSLTAEKLFDPAHLVDVRITIAEAKAKGYPYHWTAGNRVADKLASDAAKEAEIPLGISTTIDWTDGLGWQIRNRASAILKNCLDTDPHIKDKAVSKAVLVRSCRIL